MEMVRKLIQRCLLVSGFCLGSVMTHADFKIESREDGSVIQYYVEKPNTSSFPLLLVLQGSQCDSVASHLDKWPILESYGIGLLLVEKYGLEAPTVGCPEAYLKNNTIDQRLNDYLRVLSVVRTKLEGWDGRLFLLGGSEGAHVAARLASLVFPQKIVLIGGALGMPMSETLPLLAEKDMRKNGLSDGLIRAELAKFPVKYDEILANPTWRLSWGGENNTYKYWNSILFHHAWEDLFAYGGPILDIHGTEDRNAPIEGSRLLQKRFEVDGRNHLERWELEGMDHFMNDREGNNHMIKVVKRAIDWLVAE